MIVPNPNAGLWLMQEVLSPGDARFEWRRISLEQQCRVLSRPALLQAGQSYLSPVAAQALSTRVMLDLAARSELGRFAAVSSHPGFGRALWNTLSELRLARVTPEQLAPHDADLARIAAAFDAALRERALVDLAALYELAAARARTLRLPALLMFDVPITHAAEAELVRAIAAGCERASVTLPLGDTRSLDAFRAAFPRASEEIAIPRAPGELGRLQAHLFERDLSKNIPAPGSIDTSEAPPEQRAAPRGKTRSPRKGSDAQGELFAAPDSLTRNVPSPKSASIRAQHEPMRRPSLQGDLFAAQDERADELETRDEALSGAHERVQPQGQPARNDAAASERTPSAASPDAAVHERVASQAEPAGDDAASESASRAASPGAAVHERGQSQTEPAAEDAARERTPSAASPAAAVHEPVRSQAEPAGDDAVASELTSRAALQGAAVRELSSRDGPLSTAQRVHPQAELAAGAASRDSSAARSASYDVGSEQRVHFVSSPGESRECVEVARAVLDAARSGVAFDRMAVLVRAVDNYRSFIEEALERAAIPAHYAAGVRRPAPEGRAFALLLRCADSGLSVRRFAEYLSLGVMPRAEQSAGPLVSPRYWERLLLQAQVGGKSAHWAEKLDHLRTRWHEELQLVAADDAERDARQRRIDALQSLQDFALPVLSAIEALPQRASFDHYREQLSALAALALGKPGEVQALLTELSPLDHAQLGRRELVQLLAPHLHSLIVPSEGSGAGKLQVLPIEEARGRSFERVFVVGLAEKLMPPRLREDPLLPDDVRARVSPLLARMPERVANERLALRIAVAAAREHLHLSFPRFDAEQGRPRVPSFYGLEILEAVDGRLPAWSELGERASHGAAARLGWPAPDDPERAIDAAEYDLATIARARGAGALRYLVATNPHLARALRFRARRWELQKFVAADGFIVSEDSARELLRDYLAEHRHSPSALEQLAVCPYRFYLRSIVRVAGPDRAASVAALDARERGVLFHQLLHETLSELAVSDAPRALDVEAAQTVLDSVLTRLRAERSARDPQRARLVELELRSLRLDLEGFLRDQAQHGEWVPRASELRFGEATAISVAGLPVSGAIDLVEQSSAPGSGENPQLRATDFKTGGMHDALERGRHGRRSITAGGLVLQPLLYALALEQVFPEAQVHAGRLYYCTRKEHYESYVVELNERTREIATRLAQYANDMLSQGFLPAAPDPPEVCNNCEYQVICGPHEAERVQKIKRRDTGKLRSLDLLRGLP